MRRAFAGLLATCWLGSAFGLDLAVRGQMPGFAIAVGESPEASYRHAAEELRDWTEKLTGVRLAVVAATNACAIVLRTPASGSGLGEDGFRIRTTAGGLEISGGRRGILYGVYEVLETYGGIGWYASWHTVVPKADRLSVPDGLDRTERPAFEHRARSWYDVYRNPDFACRLRLNGRSHVSMGVDFADRHGGTGWRIGDTGSCHTFAGLLPASVYGKTHPEYFAEIDGTRRISDVQPCLTNPDVLEIVTANLFERIRNDPTAECFDVSQNDYDGNCTCARCRAIDEEEGSPSGSLLRFVNAVAERVEKAFPGKQVCTLAYRYSRHPPNVTKPRSNVVVRLCAAECDMSAPLGVSAYRENVSFEADLAGWSAIAQNLYVWEYATNFRNYLHTFPNAPVLLPNMRKYRDHGVRYMLEQGDWFEPYGDFAPLKVWLIAKGMWNPDQSTDVLVNRFLAGFYGAAAPVVRQIYDLLYAPNPDTANVPALIYENASDRRRIPDETLERAAELWAQAAAAVAGDAACGYNVRMSAAGVTYSRLERMVMDAKRFWVTRHPEAFAFDERMGELLADMRSYEQQAVSCRYSETAGNDAVIRERWQVAATLKRGKPSDVVVIGADDLALDKPGTYGCHTDDPTAWRGRAVVIYDSKYGWCLRFRFRDLAYDPGVKYRVRVHVKPKLTGQGGEVFYAGLYDERHRPQNVSWCQYGASDVSPGYDWYDLGAFEPSEDAIVWFSSARPTGVGEPRAAESFSVDAVEIARSGARGDGVFEDASYWLYGATDYNGNGLVDATDVRDVRHAGESGHRLNRTQFSECGGSGMTALRIEDVEHPDAWTTNRESCLVFNQVVKGDLVYPSGIVLPSLFPVSYSGSFSAVVRFRWDGPTREGCRSHLLSLGYGTGEGGLTFAIDASGNLCSYFETGEIVTYGESDSLKVGIGDWIDAAIVFSGGRIRVYRMKPDMRPAGQVHAYECALPDKAKAFSGSGSRFALAFEGGGLPSGGRTYASYKTAWSVFRGAVQQVAFWNRALDRDEISQAFGCDAVKCRLGIADGLSGEFAGTNAACAFPTPENWRFVMPRLTPERPSLSCGFALEGHEAGLPQVISVRATPFSDGGPVAIAVNGKEVGVRTVRAGMAATFHVGGARMQSGRNELVVSWKGKGTLDVDAVTVGGSWQVGRANGKTDEFNPMNRYRKRYRLYGPQTWATRFNRTVSSDKNYEDNTLVFSLPGDLVSGRPFALDIPCARWVEGLSTDIPLQVSVNGRVMSIVPIRSDGLAAPQNVHIDLEPDVLRAGFNEIELRNVHPQQGTSVFYDFVRLTAERTGKGCSIVVR